MVSLIKNQTNTQGLYFLIGKIAGVFEAWVTNNTPGEADLSTYTLYSTYIYFDSVMQLQYQFFDKYESDTQRGYNIFPDDEGTQKYYTGGHDKEFLVLDVECTRTIAEGWSAFEKYWNKTARAASGGTGDELYLVRQYASETFRQFPSQTPTLKKYIPLTILNSLTVELGTTDKQHISITCQAVW